MFQGSKPFLVHSWPAIILHSTFISVINKPLKPRVSEIVSTYVQVLLLLKHLPNIVLLQSVKVIVKFWIDKVCPRQDHNYYFVS